jgi:hypothetical protein
VAGEVDTPGQRTSPAGTVPDGSVPFPWRTTVTAPTEPPTEGTAADPTRSGADVAEAIGVAEEGSSVQEVHDHPEDTKSGTAPVERTAGDPEMTEGQVVLGAGDANGAPSTPIDPRQAGSGGAQSAPGPRISDRRSAGQSEPEGPPFSDGGS